MSAMITRLLSVGKKDTVLGTTVGPVPAASISIATFGLTSKNNVSIGSRVKQLFNTLRDNQFISRGVSFANPIYATINVDGNGEVVTEASATPAPLGIGEVRIGIANDIRPFGSALIERVLIESYDWANENNNLV